MEKENQILLNDVSKNAPIYHFFEDNTFLTGKDCPELQKSKSRNSETGESERSLRFKDSSLKNIFGLCDEVFSQKFPEATSGLEKENIFTLHSSSLLALLFFQRVSDTNPLIIGKTRYTHVHFEHKNSIPYIIKNKEGKNINRTTKSNIDVVLSDDENIEDSRNVLFLESKFSEYLHNGGVYRLSDAAYGKLYRENENISGALKEMGIEYSCDDNTNGKLRICCKEKYKYHYCEGLKQMICHYLGAKLYAEGHLHQNVALGSIVFNLSDLDSQKFNNYKEQYNILMTALSDSLKKESGMSLQKFKLIEDLLTYQNVYVNNPKYTLQSKICKFYGLSDRNEMP